MKTGLFVDLLLMSVSETLDLRFPLTGDVLRAATSQSKKPIGVPKNLALEDGRPEVSRIFLAVTSRLAMAERV